jgi:hypothetical protein
MGFKVQIDNEGGCDQFDDDDDWFSINGSVLEVVSGNGRRILYGPLGWIRVEVNRPGHVGARMRHD